jgi:hypothetical protein
MRCIAVSAASDFRRARVLQKMNACEEFLPLCSYVALLVLQLKKKKKKKFRTRDQTRHLNPWACLAARLSTYLSRNVYLQLSPALFAV